MGMDSRGMSSFDLEPGGRWGAPCGGGGHSFPTLG